MIAVGRAQDRTSTKPFFQNLLVKIEVLSQSPATRNSARPSSYFPTCTGTGPKLIRLYFVNFPRKNWRDSTVLHHDQSAAKAFGASSTAPTMVWESGGQNPCFHSTTFTYPLWPSILTQLTSTPAPSPSQDRASDVPGLLYSFVSKPKCTRVSRTDQLTHTMHV